MEAKEIIKEIYDKKDFFDVKWFAKKFKLKQKEAKELLDVGVVEGIFYETGVKDEYDIKVITKQHHENNLEYAETPYYDKHIFGFKEFIDRFFKDGKKVKEEEISEEELKKELKPILSKIIKVLKKYMDLEEDYYLLIAVWIIGTYFHHSFRSYPYLFFNAMKGSGKSRILNLVTLLSKEGIVLNSLTEAVLFRTKGTLGIDEFESVGKKGNENLRELLNSAYKKTGKVFRMKKVSGKDGESQEVEEFEVYRPILMANIWGMDETLGDRCIQLILEKSVKKEVVKLIEDFEDNFQIQDVTSTISKGIGSYGSYGCLQRIQQNWNNYIMGHNTSNSSTSSTPSTSSNTSIYNNINNTDLLGRDLELFFPLFLISDLCGKLDEMLKISVKIVKERKEKDIYESMDVQVYDFVSQYQDLGYIKVSELTTQFRIFIGTQEKEDSWINTRWMGKSIKRLKLDKEKKRSNGMLVMLDIDKAKEKIKMFREVEEPKEEQEEIEVQKFK